MLAHYPTLPLIIDHLAQEPDTTVKDEEWMLLALQQRDRVRRIRITMAIPNLRKFTIAMNKEFPKLEYMYLAPPRKQDIDAKFTLPRAFRAPRLRHLLLRCFAFSMASPLLATSIGLITLSLEEISTSAYFSPSELLKQLSSMPQLETLGISFYSRTHNTDAERQLLQMPIMTRVSLPNLRWFGFGGMSAYLEALLPQLSTPRLEKLQIWFFGQPSYPVPHLLQSLGTAANIRFSSASLLFLEKSVSLIAYPHEVARIYAFDLEVYCRDRDLQVEFVAEILNGLRAKLSSVEHLSLEYERYSLSEPWDDEAYRRVQWRKVLGLFNNVKTLLVPNGLIRELSASLQSDDGESSFGLLPELKELQYPTQCDANDVLAFAPFIKSRQDSGCPVTLVDQQTRLAQR
jgi:hypothetical protein